MFYFVCYTFFLVMEQKGIKKSFKKSSKRSTAITSSVISSYETKIEEKTDAINTLTLIPLSSKTYVIEPIWRTLEGVDTFLYITSEEQLLFKKELVLNVW